MKKPLGSQDTLIFMHIPKTAGSTLHSIVRRQYPRSRIMVTDLMGRIARESFQEIPEDKKQQIRLLLGHMAFGVHDLLPQQSAYMTMIRHPVDRAISFFYWAQQTPDIPLYEAVRTSRDLAAFMEEGAGWIYTDNGLTRFLSGQTFIPLGECSEQTLALAKENVDRYFVAVGLTERFDESLHLFRRTLGWTKSLHYGERRVTKNRPTISDLPQGTLEVIEKHSHIDLALYDYVRTIFDQDIQSYGRPFQKEVEMFQRTNVPYRKLYPLTIPFRRAAKKLLRRPEN